MSDHTTHEVVGEVGQGLGVLEVSPTAEEIVQRVASMAQGKKQPPIMVLAIDGAYVPTRPEGAKGPGRGKKRQRARRARWHGEWKEAKGFRFYLVDQARVVQVLSWHQIQKDDQLGEALGQVKEAGLIPEGQVPRCNRGASSEMGPSGSGTGPGNCFPPPSRFWTIIT